LRDLVPDLPVVSEETTGHAAPTSLATRFVLVDPLDGTRELLAGRDEFTVNIALMNNGNPAMGVVAAPALKLLWRGIVGGGAERLLRAVGKGSVVARDAKSIRARTWPKSAAVALVSRSHLDRETEVYLSHQPITETIRCGSALKFCRLAEG